MFSFQFQLQLSCFVSHLSFCHIQNDSEFYHHLFRRFFVSSFVRRLEVIVLFISTATKCTGYLLLHIGARVDPTKYLAPLRVLARF